jgi:hypothetical protein
VAHLLVVCQASQVDNANIEWGSELQKSVLLERFAIDLTNMATRDADVAALQKRYCEQAMIAALCAKNAHVCIAALTRMARSVLANSSEFDVQVAKELQLVLALVQPAELSVTDSGESVLHAAVTACDAGDSSLPTCFRKFPVHGRSILETATGRKESDCAFHEWIGRVVDDTKVCVYVR